METKVMEFIENQIGYEFQNKDLLQQAFVRRSYASENGGGDNETLEFIGDKVLDIAVVKYLADTYGYLAEECDDFDEDEYNEFFCELSEGELTDAKRRLVERKMLAQRIRDLDLAQFLIMGEGDIQKEVDLQPSVQEDLFEAILGAAAIDSNWDFQVLTELVAVMLNPVESLDGNSSENYVQLIQEWEEDNYGDVPEYCYSNASYRSSWYFGFNGESQTVGINDPNIKDLQYTCKMKIGDGLPIFRGFGVSKSDARKSVCKVAYEYLKKEQLLSTIQDEIENPNKQDAINQLEILARRGYFSIPTYDFQMNHDQDGNPVWTCVCKISEERNSYKVKSSSKKDAKKAAAYKMLKKILEQGGATNV